MQHTSSRAPPLCYRYPAPCYPYVLVLWGWFSMAREGQGAALPAQASHASAWEREFSNQTKPNLSWPSRLRLSTQMHGKGRGPQTEPYLCHCANKMLILTKWSWLNWVYEDHNYEALSWSTLYIKSITLKSTYTLCSPPYPQHCHGSWPMSFVHVLLGCQVVLEVLESDVQSLWTDPV